MRRRRATAPGLFADFGATVQKVEPPQGDPLRRTAPLTPKGQSAWFAFLNFNKSSLVIDPDDAGAPARLTELIGDCDVLIDGRDVDAADCPAFDLAALRTRNPGLIHLDVSWFGREGPYAKFEATDSTIRALTGLVKLVGPAEGPPMHAPDFQTGISPASGASYPRHLRCWVACRTDMAAPVRSAFSS